MLNANPYRRWRGGILSPLLLLIVAILCSAEARAQLKCDCAVIYQFPKLTTYPPFTSGVPTPVSDGYIYSDSIARNASSFADAKQWVGNLTYADTLDTAMYYFYRMCDHDPIPFFQWVVTNPTAMYYKYPPSAMRMDFIDRLKQVSPKPITHVALLGSHIIAHVHIDELSVETDTLAKVHPTIVKVRATIVDPIKGKKIPDCSVEEEGMKEDDRSGLLSQTADIGDCIVFQYRPQMSRDVWTDDQTDSTMANWLELDSEYVVFLAFRPIGMDGTYNYATLGPYRGFGKCGSMYPIRAGKVYDPYDDFNFGLNISPALWKLKLRTEITLITN